MSGLTESERKLRAQIAANTRHAHGDGAEATAKARQAFADSFEHQVDPDGVLPEDERARRAARLKTAHYQRLAFKSAQARRARSAGGAA